MTIQKNIEKSTATLVLSGWLDTKTSPELKEALNNLEPTVTELILDLKELEYISSAGLRQIVAANKKMSGNLTLSNVPAEIMEVFRMAGFEKKLHIV